MYEVNILFDGYSKEIEVGSEANCTCTLIKGPKNIIVDTMTAWDGPKIVQSLKEHNLECADINYVVCTHGHSDHIGCNYLFQNAIHIVGHSISKEQTYFSHDFQKSGYIIDSAVEVIGTPGHTLQDVSVIVRCASGVFVIAGDLFENEEDLNDSTIWKSAGSDDEVQQEESRAYVLTIADFIVPGHGKMFKNKGKI